MPGDRARRLAGFSVLYPPGAPQRVRGGGRGSGQAHALADPREELGEVGAPASARQAVVEPVAADQGDPTPTWLLAVSESPECGPGSLRPPVLASGAPVGSSETPRPADASPRMRSSGAPVPPPRSQQHVVEWILHHDWVEFNRYALRDEAERRVLALERQGFAARLRED